MARVQLDRIEEGFAVLVHDGVVFELPVALLPSDAREGNTLSLSLSVDEEATREMQERVKRKRERLSQSDDGGDFSL